MKRILPLLFLVCILAFSCSSSPDNLPNPDVSPFATGKPWICSSIDGAVTEDTPANLKDDFYLYCEKEKILTQEIPANAYGRGTVMDTEVLQYEQLKEMMLNGTPENHDEELVLDLLHLMGDWTARNEIGVQPLKEMVDEVEAIETIAELSQYFINKPAAWQLATLFDLDFDVGIKDISKNELTIDGPKLLMVDPEEYTNRTEFGLLFLNSRTSMARIILDKLGYTHEEIEIKIKNCLDFETLIAQSLPPDSFAYGTDYLEYLSESYTLSDKLAEQFRDFPILEILEDNLGFENVDHVILGGKNFPAGLGNAYTQDNLRMIKDYMIVIGCFSNALYLDRPNYVLCLELANESIGIDASPDEMDEFMEFIIHILPWPVSHMYCRYYSSETDKEKIKELIDDAVGKYKEIINEADFLSQAAKNAAIEKLEAIDMKVLFPDDWTFYQIAEEDLDLKDCSYFEAIKKIDDYYIKRRARIFNADPDKTRWLSTPSTMNCIYTPNTNSLYILAAYAQGGNYNSDMSTEEVMASIGYTIAHEISHAFDLDGAQFDKDGQLKQWWTDDEVETFHAMGQKIADYYDSIEIWEDHPMNGQIVVNEACADMGGLKCMLKIASGIEDFDYDAFFRAVSNAEYAKYIPQIAYYYASDSHPLPHIRVNVLLQQFDEFIDFYGIQPGDGMYLAPEDRIIIW